ncbi:MAG: acyltransferase [Phormidesmis sp.]
MKSSSQGRTVKDRPLLAARAPVATRAQITSLTGMRAALISWIVLYHLQPELKLLLPSQPLLNLAAAGYVGVDFFFITSGFIIAYNYATRLYPFNLATYRRFLWLRLARIYPVQLFALLLVSLLFLAAKVAGSAVTNPEYYSFSSLFQNLFLVQAWTLPTAFSWNAVSWAVSNEWIAYLLFPLVIAATLRVRSSVATIASIFFLLWGMTAVCLLLDSSWQAPYGAGSYGLLRIAGEFTAGCLLYNLYVARWGQQWGQKRQRGLLTNIAWIVAVIGSALLVAHGIGSNPTDEGKTFQLYVLWLTPLYAFAIYALSWQRGTLAKLFSSRPMIAVGKGSYALYLTHFIVLIVLRRVVPAESVAEGNIVVRVLLLLGYMTAMSLVAMVTYWLIEEPGRRMMKNWLPKKPQTDGV